VASEVNRETVCPSCPSFCVRLRRIAESTLSFYNILYKPQKESISIDVLVERETVWLTQAQMVELFGTTKQNISLHANNIIKDGELQANRTVKESLTVQIGGNREVQRKVTYYNLDMIISVGYRVKSQRGIEFRIWATQVLKEYFMHGYAVNRRIERLEHRMTETEKKVDFFVNILQNGDKTSRVLEARLTH
jgi:hypothetical protein